MPVLQSLPTEIGVVKNGSFVLLLFDPDDPESGTLKSLNTLMKNPDAKGIYICAEHEYSEAVQILTEMKLNPFKFFFLDLTEQTYTKRTIAANLVSVGSSSNLTEISILVTQIVQLMPTTSFIFIDSFMPIAETNGEETTLSFIKLLKYMCGRLQFSCYAMLPDDCYEDPKMAAIIENSSKIAYVGEPK